MTVRAQSPHRLDYAGTIYRFCRGGCRQKAAAAMSFSSVSVIGNALRLNRVEL